jgi:hypothetical protein
MASRQRVSDNRMTEKEFLDLGLLLRNGRPKRGALSVKLERFTGFYGVRPIVVAVLWDMLFDWTRNTTCMPKHLLWSLHFCKTYDTETVIAAKFGIDEKTYRKWLWFVLNGIESLRPHVVSVNGHHLTVDLQATYSHSLCLYAD